MGKGRLEAFSDGVLAIIITIMVLELEVPHGPDWRSVANIVPSLLIYLLSFVFLGIYWNNHHHMLHASRRVDGRVLWANLHLLFWLSLVPFATAYLGEAGIERVPTAVYGILMVMSAIAWRLLLAAICALEGEESPLIRAVGRDRKGAISTVLYIAGLALAFVVPWMGMALYVLVALVWLVPDRRIEAILRD
ncbi:MAG: TMEM175 family protein [Gemmatimonadales bacterium]